MEKFCKFFCFIFKNFFKKYRFYDENLLEIFFRGGMIGGLCFFKDNWKFDVIIVDWICLEECFILWMYLLMVMLFLFNGIEC